MFTYYRIDSAICHCQPIECQIYVLDIRRCHNFWFVVGVEKVNMIWKPANSKHTYDNYKHFHHFSLILSAFDCAFS